jgi:hypothetical protein
MTAGRGALHEESVITPGRVAKGFQIWINLSAKDKLVEPGAVWIEQGDVPTLSGLGATIRTVVGASNGLRSPLQVPTPVDIVDVTLQPGAEFRHDVARDDNAFVWVVAGSVSYIGEPSRFAHERSVIRTQRDGETVSVRAEPSGARLMLFAGRPLREPVVLGGPFVMLSQDQVDRAFADFRAGRMGALTGFADEDAMQPQP